MLKGHLNGKPILTSFHPETTYKPIDRNHHIVVLDFCPLINRKELSLLQNERRPPLSFRPQGEISGGKARDFSLSLEMTGNNVSSIFARQQSHYFAKRSII
jgi:hypothetical protein